MKNFQLHVEIKGTGKPILCLHGHPGSSQSLSVFTDHLSQTYQTLAPDLRGYGKSQFQGNFSMAEHLLDLENVLDRYQIETCLLLGWSLGGILALELALRNPQRYQGLILIASSARPFGNHPRTSIPDLLLTGLAATLNYFKPGWAWNINHLARRSLLRYLIYQPTPQAYKYLATDGTLAYLQTSSSAHQALNQALEAGYNRLDELGSLEMPSLILAGQEDRHITAQSSLETAQNLKNSQWHCYPNTAHLFPWEIPHLVLKDLDNFLELLN